MTILHFDTETIPAHQAWVRDDIRENIKTPGNIKKPESIEKWMKENADDVAHEQWLKTSFNGAVGEIICIGFAIDDGNTNYVGRTLGESEKRMLEDFNEVLSGLKSPVWCGHYITGFDLHFLWQRMIVNNVKPAIRIPHNAKPWNDSVFDTCHEWKGDTSGYGSLDTVAKILGIEGKPDGIDGSMIWEYAQSGRYQEIFDYCKDDVRIAREIYKRLK